MDENDGDAILQQLQRCETAVWNALLHGDSQADDAALDPAFLGVYPDGFSGKKDHVQQLRTGPTVASYRLSDLRVIPLGHDHAVLAYRADYRRADGTAPEAMYVSSIWRRTESGWINIFSQDTPAKT